MSDGVKYYGRVSAKQRKHMRGEELFYRGWGKTLLITSDISDSPEGSEEVNPMAIWWKIGPKRGNSEWKGQRPA